MLFQNLKNKDKPVVIDKEINIISYFLPGPEPENDKEYKCWINTSTTKKNSRMYLME